jgi:hypothetical protein
MTSRPSLLLATFLATAMPVVAGPSHLDLIPADAALGFAVRNLDDLKVKGDRFLEESELEVPWRPSQLFDLVLSGFTVHDIADTSSPAAVVVMRFPRPGEIPDYEDEPVAFVPVSDMVKAARDLGLDLEQLKAGKVQKTSPPASLGEVCAARGKYLVIGKSRKGVKAALKGKMVAEELSPQRRKVLEKADIVLHLAPSVYVPDWLRLLRPRVEAHNDRERALATELTESLKSVRYVLAAATIGDGLGLNVTVVFDTSADDTSRRFLNRLRAGETSDLRGLPLGRVLMAEASRGNGGENALLARLLLREVLRNTLEAKKFLSAADRPMIANVFGEVWKCLRGQRLAIYRNEDEPRHGLFSIVGILDTDDPQKLLDDLRDLARFSDGRDLDFSDTSPTGDRARVETLIRDLGADEFAVRETATTKLEVLGEPALSFLQQATKSPDPETARRARNLREIIADAAARRRKELLDEDLPAVRPSFAYRRGAAKPGTPRVDVIGVRLEGRDTRAEPQLRQLFGPSWNRIRLGVQGKQVVLLMGSDVRLLDETLRNLAEDRPGLAQADALTTFATRANRRRKIEFHVSLQAAAALVSPDGFQPGKAKPTGSLSSFSLTVEKDRAELDLWVPMDDLKLAVKRSSGWAWW